MTILPPFLVSAALILGSVMTSLAAACPCQPVQGKNRCDVQGWCLERSSIEVKPKIDEKNCRAHVEVHVNYNLSHALMPSVLPYNSVRISVTKESGNIVADDLGEFPQPKMGEILRSYETQRKTRRISPEMEFRTNPKEPVNLRPFLELEMPLNLEVELINNYTNEAVPIVTGRQRIPLKFKCK